MSMPAEKLRRFFNQVTYRDSKYPGHGHTPPDLATAENISARIDEILTSVLQNGNLVFEAAPPFRLSSDLHTIHIAKAGERVIKVIDWAPQEKMPAGSHDPSLIFRRDIDISIPGKLKDNVGLTLQPNRSPTQVFLTDIETQNSARDYDGFFLRDFWPTVEGPITQKTCNTIDALVEKINTAMPVSKWVQDFDACFEIRPSGDIHNKKPATLKP